MRVSLSLLIVVALFIISWAPISFVNLVETIQRDPGLPGWVNKMAVCMMYVQSAANPIIYGLMNRNFRDGYERILKWQGLIGRKR